MILKVYLDMFKSIYWLYNIFLFSVEDEQIEIKEPLNPKSEYFNKKGLEWYKYDGNYSKLPAVVQDKDRKYKIDESEINEVLFSKYEEKMTEEQVEKMRKLDENEARKEAKRNIIF